MATTSSSFVEIRDGVSLETRQYGDATGSKALVVWGHGLCNSLEGEDEDMLWDFWAKTAVGEGDILVHGSWEARAAGVQVQLASCGGGDEAQHLIRLCFRPARPLGGTMGTGASGSSDCTILASRCY